MWRVHGKADDDGTADDEANGIEADGTADDEANGMEDGTRTVGGGMMNLMMNMTWWITDTGENERLVTGNHLNGWQTFECVWDAGNDEVMIWHQKEKEKEKSEKRGVPISWTPEDSAMMEGRHHNCAVKPWGR